jgi:hypothetical protein
MATSQKNAAAVNKGVKKKTTTTTTTATATTVKAASSLAGAQKYGNIFTPCPHCKKTGHTANACTLLVKLQAQQAAHDAKAAAAAASSEWTEDENDMFRELSLAAKTKSEVPALTAGEQKEYEAWKAAQHAAADAKKAAAAATSTSSTSSTDSKSTAVAGVTAKKTKRKKFVHAVVNPSKEPMCFACQQRHGLGGCKPKKGNKT